MFEQSHLIASTSPLNPSTEEVDTFLSSTKRLVEGELELEDHHLIDRLMHHLNIIKTQQEIDECYHDLTQEICLEKRSTFYSLPENDVCCKLDEVDFEAMNYQSEYIPSPDRIEDAQQHFTFQTLSLESVSGEAEINQRTNIIDNITNLSPHHKIDSKSLQTKPRNSRLKIKGGKLPTKSSYLNIMAREEVTTAAKCSSSSSSSEASPKSKYCKSMSKPRQMLSLRTDVMNKNLFRAIRRECKSMFESYLASNSLTQSKKQKHFVPNLEHFSEHLLSVTHIDWESIPEFNTKDFATYLGIFANYCAMKKIIKNGKTKEKLDRVYSVLYAYSHVKFNEFMAVPEIRTLIKIICEVSGRESLISGNDTLLANRESYETHINKLLRSFN